MENKQIAKKESQRMAVLKQTVAKGLNDYEFSMFLELCKATKLNPFKREIWAIKTKSYTSSAGKQIEGQLQLMTGFNGYLAIANAHPEYDGMECDVVRNDGGTIDYAEARVFRKDRKRPSTVRVFFKEFYKAGYRDKPSTWDKMPVVMIQKVAKSHALREAFPQELGGLYTQEEMGEESPKVTFEQINELNSVKEQNIVEQDVEETLSEIEMREEALKADLEMEAK